MPINHTNTSSSSAGAVNNHSTPTKTVPCVSARHISFQCGDSSKVERTGHVEAHTVVSRNASSDGSECIKGNSSRCGGGADESGTADRRVEASQESNAVTNKPPDDSSTCARDSVKHPARFSSDKPGVCNVSALELLNNNLSKEGRKELLTGTPGELGMANC